MTLSEPSSQRGPGLVVRIFASIATQSKGRGCSHRGDPRTSDLPLRYHLVMFARVGLLAAVVVLCGTIGAPLTASFDLDGHESSLRARVTMSDGTSHRITLQGIGCAQGMCSRVRMRDSKTGEVWLDRLASVRDISQIATGPVHAVFTFKDGSSRETSITALNRVLYIGGRLWTQQLDLARVKQIEFE